jgi:lipopolysaccharide heptosyltransferase II
MYKHQEWSNFKNILCIRPDNMGDVIMTAPAILALKKAVPERKITLLTSSAGSLIANFISGIDDVMIFDTPWTKTNNQSSVEELAETINKIRQRNFDAAVIFNVYSQNPLPAAMICFQAQINKVAGYCRENPYQLISDWIPDPEPYQEIRHEVKRQMDLVAHLGADISEGNLILTVSEKAENFISTFLKSQGVDKEHGYIILHPGVSEERRQFHIDKFAEAAVKIVDELQIPVFITGSPLEKKLGNEIMTVSNGKVADVTGKFSLEELIAFIKNAKAVVTNNTGPAHIASATQTPVVVLYAMTNPQHAPWGIKNKILLFDVPANNRSKNTVIEYAYQQAFRNKPREIFPEDILNAVRELIFDSVSTNASRVLYL